MSLAPAERQIPDDDTSRRARLLAMSGLAAAFLTTTCCVLPFALVSMGVITVWIGRLTLLSPYQPYFVAVALALLAGGFYFVYRTPGAEDCAEGSVCASPTSARLTKGALWVGVVLTAIGVGVPYLAVWLR